MRLRRENGIPLVRLDPIQNHKRIQKVRLAINGKCWDCSCHSVRKSVIAQLLVALCTLFARINLTPKVILMRDYSRVHTAFWTSEDVRRLSEDGRTLALYLLTGPHSNMIGCFVCLKRMLQRT